MLTIYHKTVKEPELKKLESLRTGSWVHAEQPTKNELDELSEKYGLDRGLLADAMDPNEVPRVEVEGDMVYVFTRVPHTYDHDKVVFTTPILISVRNDMVFTISQHPLPIFRKFFDGRVDFYTSQRTKLFFQIFLEINHAYNSFLTDINKQVRGLSVSLERIENRDIVRFVVFEGILNDFLSALIPTSALLDKIISGNYLARYEYDEELIKDLFLANSQLIEICRVNMAMITNIRGAYSTIMTNNLNRVIKFLTALTIVLAVPTMISSFYGMNVALPFSTSPAAFWWVVGGTLAITSVIFGIFIRNRWL